ISSQTGNVVLSWDTWHGRSSDDTGFEELRSLLAQLDDAVVMQELETLIHHMRNDLGLTHLTVLGWCLGGRYALLLGAKDKHIEKIVSMHPTLPATEQNKGPYDAITAAQSIEASVMVHYPGKDHLVPWDSFERLQKSL